MKKLRLSGAIIMLLLASGINSCKKDNTSSPTVSSTLDDTQSQSISASDEATVQAQSDVAFDDANNAILNIGPQNGRLGCFHHFCDAKVEINDTLSLKTITIVYDGSTRCRGHIRQGSILIRLSDVWTNKGAIMSITFNNLKITKGDDKTIIINGSKTVTNVSGGSVASLSAGSSVLFKWRSNLSVTFDDGSTRTWGMAKSKTFVLNAGQLQVTTTGDTTIDGMSHVAVWGTTRFGSSFFTVISTSLASSSACDFDRPVSGVETFESAGKTRTVTYGVDQSGNVVAFNGSNCPYGYRINWINAKGEAKVVIRAYDDD